MELRRGRLAIKYIFFEILPTFIMGLGIFLFIILMFQSFRLTEYVIVHGAQLGVVLKLLFYMSISFLPVLIPMSLLFAILLTYGRMSNDSEIVAFKAVGLSMWHLAAPAFLIAILATLISVQMSFYLGPWGNRKMEVLVHKLGQSKPGLTIREGVFSEGFFDLVVYANKVDSKEGKLSKVFIYDERDSKAPLTIIAREGQLIKDRDNPGQKAFLRLFEGSIHSTANELYTKIDFDSYDINLFDPVTFTRKKKTPLSYTYRDLRDALNDSSLSVKKHRMLKIEFHRRWAIAFACLVFALMGVGLGTETNRRAARGGSLVLCIGLIVLYWIFYAAFESVAKGGTIPPIVAVWLANVLFLGVGIKMFRKSAS